MKVAISGSSGLIGSALVPALRTAGHQVLRLVRRRPGGPDEVSWDPARGSLDPAALHDVDAVVHLSGAGIGDRRWTPSYRRELLDSRVAGTSTIAAAIAAAQPRPRALLSASAVGWYGDTGDRAVDESGPSGAGFLAELCQAWEAATAPAEAVGTRVVRLRTGLVCAPRGGLLGQLLPLFRLGVGGRLGSGTQYWSWISLADEVTAIQFLLDRPELTGPVNLTGPAPIQNAEFSRILGRVLRRPAVLAVPAFALRLAVGGFADEGILTGQRVLPGVLASAGYRFQHATAEQAVRWATGRP